MSGYFNDFVTRAMFEMRSPRLHAVIQGVTDDGRTVKEIMDELRAEHPAEAMLLAGALGLDEQSARADS